MSNTNPIQTRGWVCYIYGNCVVGTISRTYYSTEGPFAVRTIDMYEPYPVRTTDVRTIRRKDHSPTNHTPYGPYGVRTIRRTDHLSKDYRLLCLSVCYNNQWEQIACHVTFLSFNKTPTVVSIVCIHVQIFSYFFCY